MTARDSAAIPTPPGTVRLDSAESCRCTGYVNIVKAIVRVLAERRGQSGGAAREFGPIGPVGARAGSRARTGSVPVAAPTDVGTPDMGASAEPLGLGGRKPNIEIRKSFSVAQPADEVWIFFGDPGRVVTCLPGARIIRQRGADDFDGAMAVKLGPITANFTGRARITRDGTSRSGAIIGSGNDKGGGSRAAGEVEYTVRDTGSAQTTVELTIRALLAGPLAQFGRSGVVDDLVTKMTERFSANLEARLSGAAVADDQKVLEAGSLFWSVLLGRLKRLLGRNRY